MDIKLSLFYMQMKMTQKIDKNIPLNVSATNLKPSNTGLIQII